MRFKRLISMTLAVSLTLGVFSGLPPLREATSITKEAEAANGVHKAWNWGTKNEFIDYVRKHYSSYNPVFSKKNSSDSAAKFGSVNLKATVKIPDSENETYRYWWFVTLDRYHNAHSHSYGENNRAIAQPSNKVSGNPVWGTTRLVAKPKYDSSGNANKKNGFALDYIDIKGESGKFKIDLGRTINDYGLSMYIIDLKDWMSNKGKYGYQKWANKKENKVNDDKKNVIVTMYLNAVTKTYDGGRNNYHARGLNTKEKWKNATQHMRMASYPEEYDQHYNIPVEFNFGKLERKDYQSHLIIESRVANGSTTYAKTYTNSQFQWAGSNVGRIVSKDNGCYYDVTSIKDEQFKKGSVYKNTIETKDGKIKVEDEGKFYEIGVTKKGKTVSITKKSGDKTTTHFLITDNEKENNEDNEYDKFSTSAKEGLSTAALH